VEETVNIMKRHLVLLAIIAAVIMVPSAKASVCTTSDCTYTFDSTAVGAFGSGPYGTVELTLVSGSINFTIDLLSGFHLIDTGSHEAFTFNDTVAETVTIGSFSNSIYSQAAGSGPYGNSPFGSFSDAVASTCTNGGGCGDQSVTFTVSRTGGFTDINQLVSSNGTAYFAADVSCFPLTSCPADSSGGNTGVIGVTTIPRTTSTVPEPISSTLVGAGLVSLFFLRRRATR